MPSTKDETGNRYGGLVVVSRGENAADGTVQWLCKCDCGNPALKLKRGTSLRQGAKKHLHQTCGECENPKLARARAKYLETISGKFELREEYQGKEKQIKHYCLRHKETHLASPSQINKGSGLNCCGREKLRLAGEKKRIAAAADYDKKLAKLGKLKRVGEYIASDIPILHECITHGERYTTSPDNALQGGGLRCCFNAGVERIRTERSKEALRRLVEFCTSEESKVEYMSGYKGTQHKAIFTCKVHGEMHEALPSNVVRGQGLLCCRRGGTDDLSQILAGTFFNENCNEWLYLFELRNHAGYLKFGISDIKEVRWIHDNEYGDEICTWWFDRRVDAFLVEEAIFHATVNHSQCPKELKDWAGKTEIRLMNAESLLEICNFYVERFHEVGFWRFFASYIPLSKSMREEVTRRI